MNKNVERLYNGIIRENPTFVLMLGMCPTLAVTSSAINGLGMGLSTTVVLILSNLLISAFRKVIPNGVRMPAYIVIVASLVTIVQFMMEAYTPSLSAALGVYIPLIVVNCIILGRAESYASKNPIVPSIFETCLLRTFGQKRKYSFFSFSLRLLGRSLIPSKSRTPRPSHRNTWDARYFGSPSSAKSFSISSGCMDKISFFIPFSFSASPQKIRQCRQHWARRCTFPSPSDGCRPENPPVKTHDAR